MSERHDYQPPEARIDWSRNVAGEEQYNNTINITEARRELEDAVAFLCDTGTPRTFYADDLDTGTMIKQRMDWDFIELVDYALNKEEQHLAQHGIIFEPDYRNPLRDNDGKA